MRPAKGHKDDYRRAGDPKGQPDTDARHRAKGKDTKRWCLGKYGRRHVVAWEPKLIARHSRSYYPDRFSLCCQYCGKELHTLWMMSVQAYEDSVPHTAFPVPRIFYGPGLPPGFPGAFPPFKDDVEWSPVCGPLKRGKG